MKVSEVKAKHQFHQKTFYTWMRENDLIEKVEGLGYVVGSKALSGMQTLKKPFFDASTGELKDTCQVTIDDNQVDTLVELYLASGLPKLYSSTKNSDDDNDSIQNELDELKDRVSILENQINILNLQLKKLMR